MLSVPLLLVVSLVVFVLLALAPGDATEVILGPKGTSGHPPEMYAQLAHQLGLDRPVMTRYFDWLRHALHGDLGISLITHQPVTQAIHQRLPVTLSLILGALVVSLVLGVLLGILSAVRRGSLGRVVDVLALVGWIAPVYWIAAELVVVFAEKLRWLPAIGYVPLTQSPVNWFRSLILPVLALSLGAIGLFAKYARDGMLDALSSEYVRVARANGVSERSIIFRHAFKMASLSVVSVAGVVAIGLLVGTVFVENVFALPGMGSLIVNGAIGHDIPVVQGVAVFFSIIVVAVNLITDITYTLLSPRVKIS
jgi:peptide/nickel transport system permease protein